MHLWEQYLRPTTVAEALHALRSDSDSVAVIAGGTDLLLDLEQGRHDPIHTLIDVTAVDEMREIRQEGDWLLIGAAAPLRQIIKADLIVENYPALVTACGLIGGPQVRNVATLGGNVAHALPAGDGTIALLALGAEAELANGSGTEWRPVEKLFSGPGQPAFDRKADILVRFRLPIRRIGEGSAFHRVMRPQGVAIAILNMAVRVLLDNKGLLAEVFISVGPAGPTPLRARGAEKALVGRTLDDSAIEDAVEVLRDDVNLRTSKHRSTAEYRYHLLPGLLRTCLLGAIAEAERA